MSRANPAKHSLTQPDRWREYEWWPAVGKAVQQVFSRPPLSVAALAACVLTAIEALTAAFVSAVFATRIQELGTTMTGSTDTGLFTARNMMRAGICAAAAVALDEIGREHV